MVVTVCVALAQVACGADPVLSYDEQAEQVSIRYGPERVVYRYDAAKSAFLSPYGDWAAWDNRAGNWLVKPHAGAQMRFDGAGALVWREAREVPAKQAPAQDGYNPALDVGDSPEVKDPDTSKAWQYLGDREKTAAPAGFAGDDGGAAVEEGAIGGNVTADEDARREQWRLRAGAHQGDPEGALDTGEVMDPLKKLADTVHQVQSTVAGVADTIEGAGAVRDQIKNFGDGSYDDDYAGRSASSSGSDDGVPAAAPDAALAPDTAIGGGGTALSQGRYGLPPRRVFSDPGGPAGLGAAGNAVPESSDAIRPQQRITDTIDLLGPAATEQEEVQDSLLRK